MIHNRSLVAVASGLVISLGLLMTFIGSLIIALIVVWFFVYNVKVLKRGPFSSIKIPVIALGIPLAILLVCKYYMGFDYLESFLNASRLVNSSGFSLFADPLNYLATRLEDVWEILLFLGPVCSVLLYRTLTGNKGASEHKTLSLVGISVLLLAFLAGTFETGETARTCLFILPFLLMLAVDQFKGSFLEGRAITVWLFVQTAVMQTFFSFYW
jgi:hypothetical protein